MLWALQQSMTLTGSLLCAGCSVTFALNTKVEDLMALNTKVKDLMAQAIAALTKGEMQEYELLEVISCIDWCTSGAIVHRMLRLGA